MPYQYGSKAVYYVGELRDIIPVKTLAEGEVQDYEKLKAECKAKKQKFVDPEFDPDNEDLIGDIPDIRPYLPGGRAHYTWARPREEPGGEKLTFCKNDETGNPFTYGDIKQGNIGDCFFLTGVGIITTNKGLVSFVIPPNNAEDEEWGIYHFRFWHKGYYFDVVVDDRLPYVDLRPEYGGRQFLLAKIDSGELWVPLIEKAYAKLNRKFENINGGLTQDVLEDFTGGVTEIVSVAKPKGEMNFNSLKSQKNQGTFVAVSMANEINGLVTSHAFAMIDKAEVTDKNGKQVQLVKIRNPWGRRNAKYQGEWNGRWGDGDAMWDTLEAADKQRLHSDKDDGEFWMAIEDVMNPRYVERFGFCYWFDDFDQQLDLSKLPIHLQSIHGEFSGADVNTGGWEALASQPQYVVELSKGKSEEGTETNLSKGDKCLLLLSMLSKNYIELRGNVPAMNFKVYKILNKDLLKQNPPFAAKNFMYQGFLEEVELLATEHGAGTVREFTTGEKVAPGKYLIVVYPTQGQLKSQFLLRILAEGSVTTTGSGSSAAPHDESAPKEAEPAPAPASEPSQESDDQPGHLTFTLNSSEDLAELLRRLQQQQQQQPVVYWNFGPERSCCC